MSKNKSGNFIAGGNPQVPSLTSNNGVFDTKDVYTAVNKGAWQEVDGIYEINKSLRFRSAGSAYVSRTPASAGNQRTFTFSAWVKRGILGDGSSITTRAPIFGSTSGTTNLWRFFFEIDNCLVAQDTQAGDNILVKTNAQYRDPSAWYHVMVAVDTTQALPQNRVKLYVNGVQQTSLSYNTQPSQNYTPVINNGGEMSVGKQYNPGNSTWVHFDGHMSEVNFIDGQQLDASYFGYFDSLTNIWQPKQYTGSYGTNGFYLPFTHTQTTYNLTKNYGTPSNYLPATDQLSNASYWANQNVTLTKNVTDPFGVANNAWTMATTAAGYATLYRGYFGGSTPTTGMQWCSSIFVKTGNVNYFSIALGDDSLTNAVNLIFDTTTGKFYQGSGGLTTTGSVTNASWGSQYYGNGWWRVWVTAKLLSGSSQCRTDWASPNGAGANLLVYGPQLNVGSTPDAPYINSSTSPYSADWTPNNISLTAGTTYDSMVDSPTNVMTTATDIGGVVSGNYATLNSIDQAGGWIQSGSLNWGSSSVTSNGGNSSGFRSTIGVTTGKWYVEFTKLAVSNNGQPPRVGTSDIVLGTYNGYLTSTGGNNTLPNSNSIDAGYDYTRVIGVKIGSTTPAATDTGVTFTTNDVLAYALDCDAKTLMLYKNGSQIGSTLSWSGTTPSTALHFYASQYQSWDSPCWGANFGQRAFAYTPPAGYKSLNTTNLQALGTTAVGKAALQPNKWFDISVYGATGTNLDVVNSGFAPDFVWIKGRSNTTFHSMWNSLTGKTGLSSNSTMSEQDSATGSDFVSFNSNGFSVGPASNWGSTNTGGANTVAWQWKQSPTSGFNIITYTGDGTLSRSITHNLGSPPKMIFFKRRSGTAQDWGVYHESMGLKLMQLNTSSALWNGATNYWYSAPTSSVFYPDTTNGDHYQNTNGVSYIAYLWAEVPGFSKFGSYVGNFNADGPFINLGFRPKFIMIKNTSSVGYWAMIDSTRDDNNPSIRQLFANSSEVEANGSSYSIDFLSNGFKLRTGSASHINGSGETLIYAAFAESPFALNNRAR